MAKIMIQAGIQAAAHINEARVSNSDKPQNGEEQVLH